MSIQSPDGSGSLTLPATSATKVENVITLAMREGIWAGGTQEGALCRGDGRLLERATFSPMKAVTVQDERMVVGTDGQTVTLWDTQQKTQFQPGGDSVSALSSPDVNTLAMATPKGNLMLWDVGRGAAKGVFQASTSPLRNLCGEGDSIILGSDEGDVVFYDSRQHGLSPLMRMETPILSMALQGQHLLLGSSTTLHVVDLRLFGQKTDEKKDGCLFNIDLEQPLVGVGFLDGYFTAADATGTLLLKDETSDDPVPIALGVQLRQIAFGGGSEFVALTTEGEVRPLSLGEESSEESS